MNPDFRRQFDAAQSPADALSALGFAVGSWTPTLTFATPGDLSISYTTRLGRHYKVGQLIKIWFSVVTSSFTWTTSSGGLRITGIPFTGGTSINQEGVTTWGGITKAGYSQVCPRITTAVPTQIGFIASGSGSAASNVIAADVPTGGTVVLEGHIAYLM